jgi:hypothetical protein
MKNNCIYDSDLTSRGARRKRIYIACSNNLSSQAKYQALKDFNLDKKRINCIEKTKPFKRTLPTDAPKDANERETLLKREEIKDAAIQYIMFLI